MTFHDLLVRADDETLQRLVGRDAVSILVSLNPDLASSANLRHIIHELNDPALLLRDTNSRAMLLSLLRREQANALAELLNTSVEDVYAGLEKLGLRKNSLQERVLLDFLDVSYTIYADDSEPAPQVTVEPTYRLFDHQRRAALNTLSYLRSDRPRVLLHMPTGAGKTRTAMHIIADHLRSRLRTTVIWLAYSEELCSQAADEFEQAWSCLGDRDLDVCRFWGNNDDSGVSSLRDGLIVASLSKLYHRAVRDGMFVTQLAENTSLVIIDEAHQAVAPTYSRVLNYLVGGIEPVGLLGLTATPGRTWDDIDADTELANFFDKQKVPLEMEGYSNPVDFLIDEGYLARPNFESLQYEPTNALSSRQIESLSTHLDVPESILKQLAADAQRNLVIITAVEELLERGHLRIIVFAATVAHAKILATVLAARGVRTGAVTAESETQERRQLIDQFKRNDAESMVLFNYGVLTAGFDAPRTSAAVIARPTRSLVLYSQMVGRATRGIRAGGNPSADILTVVDTQLHGFGDMAQAFTNWEDVWE